MLLLQAVDDVGVEVQLLHQLQVVAVLCRCLLVLGGDMLLLLVLVLVRLAVLLLLLLLLVLQVGRVLLLVVAWQREGRNRRHAERVAASMHGFVAQHAATNSRTTVGGNGTAAVLLSSLHVQRRRQRAAWRDSDKSDMACVTRRDMMATHDNCEWNCRSAQQQCSE